MAAVVAGAQAAKTAPPAAKPPNFKNSRRENFFVVIFSSSKRIDILTYADGNEQCSCVFQWRSFPQFPLGPKYRECRKNGSPTRDRTKYVGELPRVFNHLDKQPCCCLAYLLHWLADCGQWRIRKFSLRNVIIPNNGNILRHSKIGFSKSVNRPTRSGRLCE